MSNEFDGSNFDDNDFLETFETMTMTDDEGNEIEFSIVDEVEDDFGKYILVVESEFIDDESADAMILKEVASDDNEITYEIIPDEAEFERVAKLFQGDNDDYDLDVE